MDIFDNPQCRETWTGTAHWSVRFGRTWGEKSRKIKNATYADLERSVQSIPIPELHNYPTCTMRITRFGELLTV
jgi:hypothetical protein